MTLDIQLVEVRCRLGTEFGAALAPLVACTPGAMAAVLTDAQGDPIDFAHNPKVPELDVQLLGAQIGQTILALEVSTARHGLASPTVLVEARLGTFMACAVAGAYIVALMLGGRANVGAAWTAFEQARCELYGLLA